MATKYAELRITPTATEIRVTQNVDGQWYTRTFPPGTRVAEIAYLIEVSSLNGWTPLDGPPA